LPVIWQRRDMGTSVRSEAAGYGGQGGGRQAGRQHLRHCNVIRISSRRASVQAAPCRPVFRPAGQPPTAVLALPGPREPTRRCLGPATAGWRGNSAAPRRNLRQQRNQVFAQHRLVPSAASSSIDIMSERQNVLLWKVGRQGCI
jgi:hypothetical protein